MTKLVRIENADTSAHKVVVDVYEKRAGNEPDALVQTLPLDHPAAMTSAYIHGTRYLVVREA